MKPLLSLLTVALAFASTAEMRAEISAQAWLETYYLNPQPDEVPRAIQRLSHDGYFDQPANVAIAIGFFATVFAREPHRVEKWLLPLNRLPGKHQRLISAALWQAGHPFGAELLAAFARESPVRAEIEQLVTKPAQLIVDTPVLSPSSMNLQWGAFLASGDERHVIKILEAFGETRPALGTRELYALAQNAVAHPRVLEICRAQVERESAEVRSELRAAIAAARNAPRS